MTTLETSMEPAGVPPAEIPRIYTRLAPMYDFWARLTESRARELAVAHVRDGEHVLEVAVGTGLAFETLVHANPHGRTEGVDLTPAMLERARRKVRGLPGKHALSIADACALPFANASFDLVLNSYMLDLMPAAGIARVLAELRRVLRSTGRLVLVNMAEPPPRRRAAYLWLYRRAPRLLGGCRPVALTSALEQAGFTIATREIVTQLGFPSELILAKPV